MQVIDQYTGSEEKKLDCCFLGIRHHILKLSCGNKRAKCEVGYPLSADEAYLHRSRQFVLEIEFFNEKPFLNSEIRSQPLSKHTFCLV